MKKSVLIVDDEVEIVQFLERFLNRLKIQTITALSGEEALAVYDKDKIGLVFLDIQMKGIDGLTVLEKLREKNPKARVIMLTGKAEREYQEKATSLGALDYITKPLDLGELREKITTYTLE